jgi:hypothetical protein
MPWRVLDATGKEVSRVREVIADDDVLLGVIAGSGSLRVEGVLVGCKYSGRRVGGAICRRIVFLHPTGRGSADAREARRERRRVVRMC